MKAEISRVVENARLLAALLENHPGLATLSGTAHCPDEDNTPVTIAFSGAHAMDVINTFGSPWNVRPSRRGAGMDASKTVGGVLLVIRDFQQVQTPLRAKAATA